MDRPPDGYYTEFRVAGGPPIPLTHPIPFWKVSGFGMPSFTFWEAETPAAADEPIIREGTS